MSEIVFTFTAESRAGIDTMEYGRRETDLKVTIFKSPGKVAYVTSRLIAGVPRGHKDKRYYYWRSVASFGFRRNKAGFVTPYSCTRPWNATVGTHWKHVFPDSPFKMLVRARDDHDDEVGRAFQQAVWEEFGIENERDLYPMLDLYGLPSYRTIPNTLKVPFRATEWGDYATRIFGKKRTNKELLTTVKNTEPYFVAYAQQFRGLVPDQALINFMRNNKFDDEMEEGFQPHSPTIRPFLLKANQETRDNLIKVHFDLSDTRRVAEFVRWGNLSMQRYADYADRKNPYTNWSELVRGW